MGKIKYKELSESLNNIVKPDNKIFDRGRLSVGIEHKVGEFYYIDVQDLLPFKNQARSYFDDNSLHNLADSINKYGVRHPLTITPCEGQRGKFEVVSGERRLRAAKIAGLSKVPCILLRNQIPAEEIALIENIYRQDLHPIELGYAFFQLLEKKILKSQVEIANAFSFSKAFVSEHLGYARMNEDIRNYLISNKIKDYDILRKIYRNKDHIIDVESFIKQRIPRSQNIMRINLLDGDFLIKDKGISILDNEQTTVLIAKLELLLNDLKQKSSRPRTKIL